MNLFTILSLSQLSVLSVHKML